MKYFKNSDVCKLYSVSDKTVRNWIEASQKGRLSLELCEVSGKTYIADTLPNSFQIELLIEKGKKYRNRRSHIKVEPQPEFYKLYTSVQIKNIINNLEKYGEFPQQYRYLGEGASYWNAYLHKLYDTGKGNLLADTINLLSLNNNYLAHLTRNYSHLNLIDLGVGNGLAAKPLIKTLLNIGKPIRYIGIDISSDLLEITRQNIERWFGDSVPVETHVRDLNFEQFSDVLTSTSFGVDAGRTMNILLFLGGTLPNFRQPDQALHTIRDSMSIHDIHISSNKLDTQKARRFFDFNITSDKTPLSYRNSFSLELLSLEGAFYEVEQFFDEQKKSRFIQVRLKVDVSIKFQVEDFEKTVNLHKGESILLFRSWEWTDRELAALYEKNDFSHLSMTLSPEQEYMLMISKVRTSRLIN